MTTKTDKTEDKAAAGPKLQAGDTALVALDPRQPHHLGREETPVIITHVWDKPDEDGRQLVEAQSPRLGLTYERVPVYASRDAVLEHVGTKVSDLQTGTWHDENGARRQPEASDVLAWHTGVYPRS